MIRKKNIKNYNMLSKENCPHPTLGHIINYNLSSTDSTRMTAKQILDMLENDLMEIREQPSEEDKMTTFGQSSMRGSRVPGGEGENAAGFMDVTVET